MKHKLVPSSSTQAWTNSLLRERAVLLQRAKWSYMGVTECKKGQRSTGINPCSFSILILGVCSETSWKSESEMFCITALLPSRLSAITGTCWWKYLLIDTRPGSAHSKVRHKSRSHKKPRYLLCRGKRYDRQQGWPWRKGRTCVTQHCYADIQYSQQKGIQIHLIFLTFGTSKYLSTLVI